MHYPQAGDYIDIHVHEGRPSPGVFILESLMAHEDKKPVALSGVSYTYGIHPWFLNKENHKELLSSVQETVCHSEVIAVGEAGFDRLRGPSEELQREVFEEQVVISEEIHKPVIIHCVKAWDDLMAAKKKLKPRMPWLIHGFRGNHLLADQLLSKGMYLSIWFEFALRPESGDLLRNLPGERLFLETDGADVDIRSIYHKVAADRNQSVDDLKADIHKNYKVFFK